MEWKLLLDTILIPLLGQFQKAIEEGKVDPETAARWRASINQTGLDLDAELARREAEESDST